jgi:anthranilate phosphoribosyltransferase
MMNYSQTLTHLLERHDLPFADMRDLMAQIMGGQLTSAQIAAMLIALRAKAESVTEIAAAATVMRELSTKVQVKNNAHLIDTCGTGGDGAQTFNISTASAIVAAAAGAHATADASSTCGSADASSATSTQAEQVAHDEIVFYVRPWPHPCVVSVRTLFNLLGPSPTRRNRCLACERLPNSRSSELGSQHGSTAWLDEITISGTTHSLKDGKYCRL